jgi:hypothetical protein
MENTIINQWINKLELELELKLTEKVVENKLITLSIETLVNLIDLLSNEYGNQKEIKNKINSKLITRLEKNVLQIYNENIVNFFIKKQLNSNWTYLKYKNYKIRWNIIIYLYQKDTKSYIQEYKKKTKKKEIENNKPKILKFNDFFDKETDDEEEKNN